MSNITIALNDQLLQDSRRYAKLHSQSLNDFVRTLLIKTVRTDTTDWLDECFQLMNRAKGNSQGKTWQRADLYR